MSGSVPISLVVGTYNEIINSVKLDAKLIVDTSKSALTRVIEVRLFLVKTNIHEISEIFGAKINSLD